MSQRQSVPFIPDNAPFTPSQRAWLNGFLAGMFCQTTAPAGTEQHSAAKPKLSVLVGSQSGNAESLAKRFVKEAKKLGYEATLAGLDKTTPATLAQEKWALVITSTWGSCPARPIRTTRCPQHSTAPAKLCRPICGQATSSRTSRSMPTCRSW